MKDLRLEHLQERNTGMDSQTIADIKKTLTTSNRDLFFGIEKKPERSDVL